MKPTFAISCPIDTYSGYGARSRDLVKAIASGADGVICGRIFAGLADVVDEENIIEKEKFNEEKEKFTESVYYRGFKKIGKKLYRDVFGFIPIDYTFRQTMRHVITVSPFARAWDVFQMCLSIIGCALYVSSTYDYEVPLVVDLILTLLLDL